MLHTRARFQMPIRAAARPATGTTMSHDDDAAVWFRNWAIVYSANAINTHIALRMASRSISASAQGREGGGRRRCQEGTKRSPRCGWARIHGGRWLLSGIVWRHAQRSRHGLRISGGISFSPYLDQSQTINHFGGKFERKRNGSPISCRSVVVLCIFCIFAWLHFCTICIATRRP